MGATIYRGPSAIGRRSAIKAIITGLDRDSANPKTGPMAQLWIEPDTGETPGQAIRAGTDDAICGDCKLRPFLAAKGGPRCYVNPMGPTSAAKGASPGVEPIPAIDRQLRLGAHGDPGALPIETLEALRASALKGWTGYTHAWKDRPVSRLLMASVDSPEEREQAKALGFRTFRVRRAAEDPLLPGEISCPASAEAGHRTTCDRCMLCNGNQPTTRRSGNLFQVCDDPRKDIAIIDHGPGSKTRKDGRV